MCQNVEAAVWLPSKQGEKGTLKKTNGGDAAKLPGGYVLAEPQLRAWRLCGNSWLKEPAPSLNSSQRSGRLLT